MKREIKFRGKRLDIGEWHYGDLTTKKISHRFSGDTCIFDGGWHVVDPYTVGQYTGLKDRNGLEIYEGDVVTNGKHTGFVKWMPGKCCFQISPGGVFLSAKCEVVGIVYGILHNFE